ncbi:MAG: MarR family winged helix-turn-helix transcriptional regulator [Pseudomonadota bacterium]
MTKKSNSSLSQAKLSLAAERAEGLAADELNAWRHDNIGRLALFCYNHFEASMLRSLARQGITDVKPMHLRVFRNIDYDGTRVTEIAARANITKGAMSQALAECERLGYVLATADAVDARARVIKFTAEGREMMECCRTAIAEVEAEFEATVGARKYADLRALLVDVRAGLVASADT